MLAPTTLVGDGIVHTFSNKGGIWSSAGVLRRMLKCRNLRNPYRMFAPS